MIGNPIRYICKAKPFGFGVVNDNFWGSEYPILFIQATRASISLGEREMSSSRIVYTCIRTIHATDGRLGRMAPRISRGSTHGPFEARLSTDLLQKRAQIEAKKKSNHIKSGKGNGLLHAPAYLLLPTEQ